MGVKRGYVVEEDTPRAGSARIRRFKLSSGDRVYLPDEIARFLLTRHSPAEEFFFIEKGLLGRTAWAGTLHELRLALAEGAVSTSDVRGLRLPQQVTVTGWDPMSEEDDHASVGAKLPLLTSNMREQGRTETANAMTVDAWALNASEEGACMVERNDVTHGRVRCGKDRGHRGNHGPLCPECDIVKQVMYAVAQSAGAWGGS